MRLLLLFLTLCLCLSCEKESSANTPTFVAGPIVLNIQSRSALLSWATDRETTSTVTLTPIGGGSVVALSLDVPSTAHDLPVSGLLPNTEYETRIIANAAGFVAEAPALRFTTLPEKQQLFRVLFDAAHGEAAGNADWVIDDGERFASPSSPSSPTDWEGAISSWGFELFATGRYEIETLPAGVTIQFGTASAQDLSNYDAFILPEPNNPISSAERNAIVRYVQSGGGLILIADHIGADRDNDGFDAVEILNQLMNQNGVANNVFGAQFDAADVDSDPANNLDLRQGVPVIDGPFGIVQQIGINRGTTMTLRAGGPAQPIGWANGAARDLNNVIAAVSSVGTGKVFLLGDSSPFDDGTARPGNDNIFDSWNVPTQDNATLFLNAVSFVVGE